MDESLREIKLLGILDALLSSEEPLTIPQIQYRLGVRGVDMARDVIEAHLSWGLNQPNATNAPIRVTRALHSDKWYYVYKHPPTAEEIKAAGPPPFDVKYSSPEAKKQRREVAEDIQDKLWTAHTKKFDELYQAIHRITGKEPTPAMMVNRFKAEYPELYQSTFKGMKKRCKRCKRPVPWMDLTEEGLCNICQKS